MKKQGAANIKLQRSQDEGRRRRKLKETIVGEGWI